MLVDKRCKVAQRLDSGLFPCQSVILTVEPDVFDVVRGRGLYRPITPIAKAHNAIEAPAAACA